MINEQDLSSDSLRPVRNGVVPFGYRLSDDHAGFLEPIPDQLEHLQKAIGYVQRGDLSLRNAADWLFTKTGRKISAMGLSKLSKNSIRSASGEAE